MKKIKIKAQKRRQVNFFVIIFYIPLLIKKRYQRYKDNFEKNLPDLFENVDLENPDVNQVINNFYKCMQYASQYSDTQLKKSISKNFGNIKYRMINIICNVNIPITHFSIVPVLHIFLAANFKSLFALS